MTLTDGNHYDLNSLMTRHGLGIYVGYILVDSLDVPCEIQVIR